MSPIGVSLLVFASVFLGSMAGLALRSRLPEHHLGADSKDAVKLGTGLIGTMAALLLGLLIASAKNSYDAERGELTQMAAKIDFLDRLLAKYGPESHDARELLRASVARAIDQMWPQGAGQVAQLDPRAAGSEPFYEMLHQLTPQNDRQTALKAQALSTATEIAQLRWLLMAQRSSSVSTPMLIVVVFWLMIIFLSVGLFAPSNPTVITTLLLCALSVAGAIFLVLELDQPFGGMIQISSAPMHSALEHMGQ